MYFNYIFFFHSLYCKLVGQFPHTELGFWKLSPDIADTSVEGMWNGIALQDSQWQKIVTNADESHGNRPGDAAGQIS